MVKQSASINLLKTDRKETINQFVNWLSTIGRVLIIVVELIALSAFMYRFILDNQIREIRTKIKQEQAIITLQKKNEDAYRNLQNRLSVASEFANKGLENIEIFKDVVGFAPNGMTFTNVTLFEDNIRIEANVSSVTALSIFINALKAYSQAESISIDKIENKTASAVITVSVSLTLKQKGGANAANGNQ